MLTTTSSSASIISNDLEPEYIEDSCVALLSFGMWQEKKCSEALPYICYDGKDFHFFLKQHLSLTLIFTYRELFCY